MLDHVIQKSAVHDATKRGRDPVPHDVIDKRLCNVAEDAIELERIKQAEHRPNVSKWKYYILSIFTVLAKLYKNFVLGNWSRTNRMMPDKGQPESVDVDVICTPLGNPGASVQGRPRKIDEPPLSQCPLRVGSSLS
jgi:hypothetical protein